MAARVRTGRSYRFTRPVFRAEQLEPRMLLSSVLVPTQGAQSLIYDPTRQLLYAVRQSDIQVVDVGSGIVLAAIQVQNARQGDITPDGRFLYLTDDSANVIHKINLATHVDTPLAFNPAAGERDTLNLAIMNNNTAIFDAGIPGGSGGTLPLYTLDLATDAISLLDDPTGTPFQVNTHASLQRSADRSKLLIDTWFYSPASFEVYDVTSNAIVAGGFSLAGFSSADAISRDGSMVVKGGAGVTDVYDASLQHLVHSFNFSSQAAFSPANNLLYLAHDSTLDAFDTTSWAQVLSLDIGEAVDIPPLMQVSNDGLKSFIPTGSGIRIVTLDNQPSSVTLTPSADGQTLQATVQATGNLAPYFPNLFSGAITLYDGKKLVGQITLSGSNTVTFDLNILGNGKHRLYAVYAGDEILAPSQSDTLTIQLTGPRHAHANTGKSTALQALGVTNEVLSPVLPLVA